MKIAKICPKCGTPGIEVNKNAVDFFFFLNQQQNDWSACVNKKCKVGYFSSDHVLNTHDLNSILWYKTDSKKAYTCYCSKLTRADIIQAVKQDAKTFTDVQKMTGKNKTGFYTKENPLGKCCKETFIFEVEKAKKKYLNLEIIFRL